MNENKIKYATIEYHKMYLKAKFSPYTIIRTMNLLVLKCSVSIIKKNTHTHKTLHGKKAQQYKQIILLTK
jgi:hypothetical protein